MLQPRRILITGGTGFLGSHVVEDLALRFPLSELVVVTHRSTNFSIPCDFPNIRLVPNTALFNEVPNADFIFHLASYGVNYLDDDINQMILTNVGFLSQLLLLANKARIQKFVSIGTAQEYGDHGPITITESASISPVSRYGLSKAAAWFVGTSMARQQELPFLHLRPFGVYGPGEGAHKFVPQIIRALKTGVPLQLTNGTQIRDYLYVKDFTSACIEVGLSDQVYSGTYNICSGQPISLREFGEMISGLMGGRRNLLRWGDRAPRKKDPPYLVGNPEKLMTDFGWSPKFTKEDGLKTTIRFYQQ